MKNKIHIFLITLLLFSSFAFASEVYCENKKFGLKDNSNIITKPIFSKLISLRNNSYIFLYRGKYGIISKNGEILVKAEHKSAQRYFGKYVRLEKNGKFGIWDDFGKNIIPQEYSFVDVLYGRMFLVCKDFKYGLISFEGNEILHTIADDIYMPQPNIMRISYGGVWYEIEHKNRETLELPDNIKSIHENKEFRVDAIVQKPITSAGYGVVSASDYLVKVFSSISPSYEETIDELILNYGADTATILVNPSWIAQFPYVYIKKYLDNLKAPNNGPFSDVKSNLLNKLE